MTFDIPQPEPRALAVFQAFSESLKRYVSEVRRFRRVIIRGEYDVVAEVALFDLETAIVDVEIMYRAAEITAIAESGREYIHRGLRVPLHDVSNDCPRNDGGVCDSGSHRRLE